MAAQLPCPDYLQYCIEPDSSCKDFIMQQTMMRIKDPKRSLKFYTEVLGMRYVILVHINLIIVHALKGFHACMGGKIGIISFLK